MSIIFGNWKMNQSLEELEIFASMFKEKFNTLKDSHLIGLCPQFIHLAHLKDKFENLPLALCSQNCSQFPQGAYTGEVSSIQLKEMGVNYTLIGHSERRAYFNESHAVLNQKALQALQSGLKVIFCCGETIEERDKGLHQETVFKQLSKGLESISLSSLSINDLIIAYEPVWAIGTGRSASPEDANSMHEFIKKSFENLPVIYGGSVKPSNAASYFAMPHIDGALVGGASLKAQDFIAICSS